MPIYKRQERKPVRTKIKKNDSVIVIAGDGKGIKGRVLKVQPQEGTIIVEKVNLIKKATRRRSQQDPGGIIEKEAPIDISNVKLIDPSTGKPTRVGRTVLADGTIARISKVSGEVIEETKK
jgi:large subunit ribosomal protein L24